MAEFRLGRLKFNWKGPWTTSTAYVVDDIVRLGANDYVCITNHTSTGIGITAWYDVDSSNWQLHVEGFKYRGAFTTDTSYTVNDIVNIGGNKYICTSNHTSVASTSLWAGTDQAAYWDTYLEGIRAVSEWTPNTYWSVNDLAKIGGNVYRVLTAHAGAATTTAWESSDKTNWEVFVPGQDVVGAYTTNTMYGPNDLIKIGPRQYQVNEAFTASGVIEYAKMSTFTDGFEHRGKWDGTNYYKTGDVVEFNGNAYVAITDNNNKQPNLNTSNEQWNDLAVGVGTTANVGTYSSTTVYNQSDLVRLGGITYRAVGKQVTGINPVGVGSTENWQELVRGLNYAGPWASGTTYELNDIVEYLSSSYVSVASSNMSVTPGTDAAFWNALAIGDSNALLTTRGDVLVRDASGPTRLGIGSVGTALLSNGTDVHWNYSSVQTKVLYVDPYRGNNDYPGISPETAFASLGFACTSATGPQAITNIQHTGGTGFATITAPSHGILFNNARVKLANVAFSTATLITQVGFSSNIFPATNGEELGGREGQGGGGFFFDVIQRVDDDNVIINIGTANVDLAYVEGGTITDVSPTIFKLSAGDFFEQLPITLNPNVSVVGDSLRATVINPASGLSTDGSTPNNRQKMFKMSDGTVLQSITMKGMTGFNYNSAAPFDIGQTNLRIGTGATACGTFVSLEESSPILRKSPYIKDCSTFSHGGVGVFIDGGIHTTGNKSMVFDSFTTINSDGAGYVLDAEARAEIVSCFTYYCTWGYFAGEGSKVRSVGGNNSYGVYGAIASGFGTGETARTAQLFGDRIDLREQSLVGDIEVGMALTGLTSGAEATLLNDQSAGNFLIVKYNDGMGDPVLGIGTTSFVQGETIEFPGGTVGIVSNTDAVAPGQKGIILEITGLSTAPLVGDNLGFTTTVYSAGVTTDANFYIISAVSGFTTATGRATVTIAPEKSVRTPFTTDASGNPDSGIEMRTLYSQMRLTGHDFLSVGTGNSTTTNYPNVDETSVEQGQETNVDGGGKVFFTSTDQSGNFRVGEYFSVDQLTGRATLDASAFNLSGLTELRLGAIGGQIGETIKEFSADVTMAGNSNEAVPTERAVKTYVDTEIVNSNALNKAGGTMTGDLILGTTPIAGAAGSMYAAPRTYVDDTVGPAMYFAGNI